MIDFAKITVRAGDGGNGAGSFFHTKGKRRGKADGGDGGRGGNVFFAVSGDLNTLEPFRFVKEYKAQGGQHGASKRRKGAEGEDLVIKVPRGTLIKAADEKTIIFDMDEVGEKVLAVRGGEGGRGNAHLRDEYGRRPLAGEKGEEGEVLDLVLELKLIADVGLVGLPNAGKSTLLRALTSATPKVADYPFTTLEPNLGVLSASGSNLLSNDKEALNADQADAIRSIVIADIPGLIEGASEGKGLGDLFLRHIDRTKLIVHVIDGTSEDVWRDYRVIRNELRKYGSDIFKKREIVVLNKTDLMGQTGIDLVISIFKKKKKRTFAISAQTGEGIKELANAIVSAVA